MPQTQTVDEAIARMTFDNKQFEQGVQQSLESLEKLKAATNFDESAKGFSGLAGAIKSVDLSGIYAGARTATVQFSAMGAIGFTAMQRLTNAAIDLGAGLVRKVMGPLKSVWSIVTNKGWARASNVKQAQFMVENLGLSWEAAYKDIDEAVTGTRFGFDEAATAASQLAASGLHFGEDMPDALKAIANSASMANVEFSDMANVFTTIAGNGRVMGEQLQQFSGRGLNAASLIAKHFKVTEQEAREMVTKKQVSFEDFVKSVNEEYGEASKKANDTFTGVLANNKAVFARIGQVYASGFMDAAKKVLQATLPMLKAFEKTIKPIGEVASKAMGVIADKLVPIIQRIDFTPIQKFIDKYVVPIGERLGLVSSKTKEVKDAIDAAGHSAEEFSEIVKRVIRGDFGNGVEKRRKALNELGWSFELVQNKVNELLGCAFRYEVAEEDLASSAGEVTDEFDAQTAAMKNFFAIVFKNNSAATVIDKFARAFAAMHAALNKGKRRISEFFVPLIKKYLPIAAQKLVDFAAGFAEGSEKMAIWLMKIDPIGNGLNFIAKSVGFVITVFKTAKGIIDGFVSRIQSIGKLSGVEHLGASLGTLLGNIGRVVERLITSFKKLLGMGKTTGETIFGKLGELFGFSKGFSFDSIFEEHGMIDRAAEALAKVVDQLNDLPSLVNKAKASIKNMVPKEILDLVDKMPSFSENAKTIFGIVGAGGSGILRWLTEIAKKTKAFQTFSGLVNELGGKKVSAKASDSGSYFKFMLAPFLDFMPKIPTLETEIEHLGVVAEAAKDVGDKVVTLMGGRDNVMKAIMEFFGLQTAPTVTQQIDQSSEDLQQSTTTFYDTIASFTESASKYSGNVQEVIDKFSELSNKYIGKVTVDKLINIAKGIAVVGLLRKLGKVAKSTSKFLDGLKLGISGKDGKGGLLGSFSGIGKSLSGMFDNIGKGAKGIPEAIKSLKKKNFSAIFLELAIAIRLIIGSLYMLTQFDANELQDAMANLALIVGAIGSLIGVIATLPTTPEKITAIGTAFAGIGAGLLLLVGAVKLFGMIPDEQLVKGGSAIIAFMLMMATAVAIAGEFGKNGALGFVSLALAIDMLIPAVLTFSALPIPALVKAGVAIAGFMAMLVLASKYAGKVGLKTAAAFIALALAVDLLVPAVIVFATIPGEKLLKGGLAVVSFMTMMALATKIAGSSGVGAAASFLALAVAVNILVPAIWLLGTIKPEKVATGILAINLVMLGLAGAARIAKGGGASTIIAMAATIGVITLSLVALSLIKTNKLTSAVAALDLTILAIAHTFKVMGKMNYKDALGSAVGMGLVLAGVTIALYELSQLPLGNLLGSALALVSVIGVCSLALKLLSGIDPGTAAKAGAALDAFLVVVGALGVLIGALISIVGDYASQNGVDLGQKFQEVANSIGLAIHAFTEGLHGNDLKAQSAETVEVAENMTTFGEKIQGFLDALNGVDESVLQNADLLASAMLKFAAAEVLDAFSQLVGEKDTFEDLGESLKAYAKSLNTFAKTIDTKALSGDSVSTALKVTDDFLAIAEKLPRSGGWVQEIIGEQDMHDFGAKMCAYASCYKLFIGRIGGVKANRKRFTEMYINTDKFIGLANKLKNNVGIITAIIGYSDLGVFGENMAKFAAGYGTFATTINTDVKPVNGEIIDNVTSTTEKLVALAKKVKKAGNSGGLAGLLLGDNDVGTFGKSISEFGTGMSSFCESLEGVDFTKIQSAMEVLSKITELNTIVTGGGDNSTNLLYSLSASISSLGKALGDMFSNNLKDVDSSKISSIGASLKDMILAMSEVDIDNLAGVSKLSDMMSNLAKTAVEGFKTAFTQNINPVTEAVQSVVTAAETAVAKDPKAFTTAGQNEVQAYTRVFMASGRSGARRAGMAVVLAAVSAILSQVSRFTNAGRRSATGYASGIRAGASSATTEARTMVTNAASAAGSSAYEAFRGVGNESAQGYKQGIMDYAQQAAEEAAAMVRNAREAARAEQDSNSPSKEYAKLGVDADRGYILGIQQYGSKVNAATSGMVGDGIKAMKAAMLGMSMVLNEGLEADPTITPVLDLSTLASQTGLIGQLLGNQTLTVGTLDSTNAILANQQSQLLADQNALAMINELTTLNTNSRLILNAIREGKVITINGDVLFNYINRRFGQA